ncbi:MAG: universal stress protein [Chloroflexi bacterium]|nr:universal stress protein [Chloroflexota bacterium]
MAADRPRVLVCVDGNSARQLLAAAAPLVGRPAHWGALHVIGTRARLDLGALRHGMPGAGRLPPHMRATIEDAGREHANVVLAAAAAALAELQLASDPGLVRVGEPGREICAAAIDWSADLLVLQASRQPRPEPGPRSVGHTARFVVDHAPCPVLLIRG